MYLGIWIRRCGVVLLLASGLGLMVTVATSSELPSARLAYVSHSAGGWEIGTDSPDIRNPISVTETVHDESEPSWSSDRRSLVHSASDGRLYIVDVTSKEQEEIDLGEGLAKDKLSGPCFSPDGKQLVFVHFKPGTADDTDLMIYDFETKLTRRLIDQHSPQFFPRWSPDGEHIVYTNVHCSSECGRIIQELWITNPQGNFARQLLMTNAHCMQPVWSPDSKRIAFASDKSDNFEIWILSLEDWKLTQLTDNPSMDTCPAWSPDGKKIAFLSTRTGKSKIWIQDLETGRCELFDPLPDKNTEYRDIAW